MDLRARVIELNTIRMKVIQEGDALLESLKGREMSGEERQTWERLNERVDEIDAEVRSLVQRETRETEAAALRAAAEVSETAGLQHCRYAALYGLGGLETSPEAAAAKQTALSWAEAQGARDPVRLLSSWSAGLR